MKEFFVVVMAALSCGLRRSTSASLDRKFGRLPTEKTVGADHSSVISWTREIMAVAFAEPPAADGFVGFVGSSNVAVG